MKKLVQSSAVAIVLALTALAGIYFAGTGLHADSGPDAYVSSALAVSGCPNEVCIGSACESGGDNLQCSKDCVNTFCDATEQ